MPTLSVSPVMTEAGHVICRPIEWEPSNSPKENGHALKKRRRGAGQAKTTDVHYLQLG